MLLLYANINVCRITILYENIMGEKYINTPLINISLFCHQILTEHV